MGNKNQNSKNKAKSFSKIINEKKKLTNRFSAPKTVSGRYFCRLHKRYITKTDFPEPLKIKDCSQNRKSAKKIKVTQNWFHEPEPLHYSKSEPEKKVGKCH